MSKINDGGPAFAYGDNIHGGHSGMSLRDYFAAQALNGLLASVDPVTGFDTFEEFSNHLASTSYKYADALLAAREVTP